MTNQNEKTDKSDANGALLAELIMMLSTSAMQQMGKLVNPATRKAEVNLEAAQVSIDLLAMLQTKTKGNLTPQEEALLHSVLSSLQMTFVETANAQPAATPPPADAGQATPPPSSGPAPTAESATPDAGHADSRDPKYHKSYG